MTLHFAVLRFPPFGEQIVRVEDILPRVVTHVRCRDASGTETTYQLVFKMRDEHRHHHPQPSGPVYYSVCTYDLEEILEVDETYELCDQHLANEMLQDFWEKTKGGSRGDN